MIIIELPSGMTVERRYVVDVLFGEWLGVRSACVDGRDKVVRIRVNGSVGSIEMPDAFFASLSDERFLTAEVLPDVPLEEWRVAECLQPTRRGSLGAPVLFGEPAAFDGTQGGEGDVIYLPIDIFGSAFFMLSRYEEAVSPVRDGHDRFPGTASIAYKAGFLDRPLIDEYVEILWAAMKRLWPGLPRKVRQSRTVVTCDVDSPFVFDGSAGSALRKVGGDLLRRRSPRQAARSVVGAWYACRGDYRWDPHRGGLEHIMSVNEKAGRAVGFYFIPENTSAAHDNRVSLDQPRMRALMREMHARGHEIGIHPGYNTYRHPEAMARSVATLRRVMEEEGIDQPELGGRQHFLRWESPTTARLWDDCGLDYDSTLSFADLPGFRCGTCKEFPLYDLHERRPLRVRERPLILMECSVIAERYLGMGYSEAALEKMKGYRDICHRMGGDFVLLWHNSHFNNKDDHRFYAELTGLDQDEC